MRYWFIYLLLLPLSAALVARDELPNGLTLEQAIVNVLEHSPLLKAADYEAKAAAARIRAARLSPAFQSSIEFENFAGSGNNSGSNNLEATLSLSRIFELGAKSRIRGELAHNKALLLQNDQDAKRLDLLAETAQRFINIVMNQERSVIARDSHAFAEKTRRVVARRVKTGKTPTAELRRAKMASARKELMLKQINRELSISRLKLTSLWGQTQTESTTAEASLFAVEPIAPFEQLVELLDKNPDLVRFATASRLAETRIQLANSGRRPDIGITGGLRHFNATDDTGLVLSLDIPLGSASRALADVEEAEMLQLLDPEIYQERRLTLYASLYELHQQISHAMETVLTLHESIIPQAQRALKDYEKGYAAGRYSFLELTEAQRVLLDSRLEAVMAAVDYHRYRIEIDRLTGAGLSTGVKP